MMSLSFFVLLLLLSLVGSACLTFFLRRWLLRAAVMDEPNERSLHKTPVPRGGGWAIVAVCALGILPLLRDAPHLWPLLPALFLLAFVSFWDDKRGLGPVPRLLAHLIAATLGSMAFGQSELLFGTFLPFALDRAVMILLWAWLMNLTNFMDGIDGITGTQTILCAAGAAFLFFLPGVTHESGLWVAALLIGASAGFLLFNWHPAKIFLGDVGSVPLGFLTGFLLFSLVFSGLWAAALILPLYYLADSGLTITARALRGEKIWRPHREHFYQRATLGSGTPVPVVKDIALADLALIGAAFLAVARPAAGLALGFVLVTILLLKLRWTAHKNETIR